MKKRYISIFLMFFVLFLVKTSDVQAKDIDSNIIKGETIVNIPDDNLKKLINDTLGKGEVLDDVTQTEMESITSLGTYNVMYDISSLEGLQYAVNLQYLKIAGANIEDLSPISGLTNLMSIDISGSNITDLTPISNLENLNFINVERNNISDISPFSNLKKLEYIDVAGNNISDISPATNLSLDEFYIGENQILDFSPMPSVGYGFSGKGGQFPVKSLYYPLITDVPSTYDFSVIEKDGTQHDYSVDLSGIQYGDNTFTFDYGDPAEKSDVYKGTLTLNIHVGNFYSINVKTNKIDYKMSQGILSDEEILEMLGVSAVDEFGNDMTDQVSVDSSGVNWEKEGSYKILLNIDNLDGSVESEEISIEVKDDINTGIDVPNGDNSGNTSGDSSGDSSDKNLSNKDKNNGNTTENSKEKTLIQTGKVGGFYIFVTLLGFFSLKKFILVR